MNKYLAFLLFFSFQVPADNKFDWELIVNRNNLQVYRGTKQKNNIYPIRGDFKTNYSPADVMAIMLDIKRKPEWLPKLTRTKLIKRLGPQSWIEYAEIDVPWPCQNRDIVFQIDMKFNANFSKVTIGLKSVQNDLILNKNNIRALIYPSTFLVTLNNHSQQTLVQSQSFVDPRGSIPRWIVNLFQKTQTIKIAQSLQKRLEEKLYPQISIKKLKSGPFH